MNDKEVFRLVSKTQTGLEEVLAEELRILGAEKITILKRGVEYYGDKKFMYKANYWLRTAINVLKPIAKFPASNQQELYDGMRNIEWMKLFDIGNTISVNSVSYKSQISHTQFISQKAKDAVVDYFRDKFGQRPDVDRYDADIQLHIYLNNDECEVSMNSSGGPLFRRGYRQEVGIAPLNEILAAGMIQLSNWDKTSNFIDPMCGSGTLAIEAALMAFNIPPAFYRSKFSFMRWSNYSAILWKEVLNEAFDLQKDYEGEIIASDISPKSIETCKLNVEFAKLHKDIQIKQCDISNLKPPEGGGVIIMNPPYGERIKSKDINELYIKIGDALKFNFTGFDAWVISSDLEAIKLIGLRPKKRYNLQNGALECKFNGYSIYKGKKFDKQNDEDKV